MLSTKIKNLFESALKEFIKQSIFSARHHQKNLLEKIKDLNIELQIPDKKFGDYTTNLAMASAKMFSKSPMQIADALKDILQTQSQWFTKIDVVKPGFINLTLHSSAWQQSLLDLVQALKPSRRKINFPRNEKRILLEYVSANPTGPLHIGHGRWAVIGDILAKVLIYLGYDVEREFYVNDAGEQIKMLHQSLANIKNPSPNVDDSTLSYGGEYLKSLKNSDVNPVDHFLDEHKKTLKKINVSFDNYFRESSLHAQNSVVDTIKLLVKKNLCYEKDDALWLKTTAASDDKDRVLKKADGSYTYFAVDCAYHLDKIKRHYASLVNIFGADHHGYINRLQSAVQFLAQASDKPPPQLHVVIGQLVKIYRSGEVIKMSKRNNIFITLDEVIDEIGQDAARYYLAMRSSNTPLEFDLEHAKKNDMNNPVYYIQYAHARIHSVFDKAKTLDIIDITPNDLTNFDYPLIADDLTNQLVNQLNAFHSTLKLIAKSYEVYHLPSYLYALATLFHKLYNQSTFISPDRLDKSKSYLQLLDIIRAVLKEGLTLLNINAPQKM